MDLKCSFFMFAHSTPVCLGSACVQPTEYSECIWDKDTDEMVWYPDEIDYCNSKPLSSY